MQYASWPSVFDNCALGGYRRGGGGNFFSIWVFFHVHSGFTGQQGKEEAI